MTDIEIFKLLKIQLNEFKDKYKELEFMFIAYDEMKTKPYIIYVPHLEKLLETKDMFYLHFDFNTYTTITDIKEFISSLSDKNDLSFRLLDTKYRIINPLYKDIVLEMSKIKDKYNNCERIDEIYQLFEESDFVKRSFEINLKNRFMPKEKKKDNRQLIMDGNIFVTSDLHLSHANMMDWESGRWSLCDISQHKAITEEIKSDNLTLEEFNQLSDSQWDNYKKRANEKYVKKYDEEIIRRWNEVVKEKDTVYVLGDFSFASGKDTNKYLKQMNGKKILIKGNHENIWMDKDADLSLWYMILDYAEIKYKKNHFCMMHFPIQTWNKQHHGSIHLYGHVHSNTTTSHPMRYEIENSYNVGVDVNNYYPININNFIKEQM